MDPMMGIVGALVITKWSIDLMRDTSSILLDRAVSFDSLRGIRSTIEAEADSRVTDFHVWPIGSHHFAAIVSIVTHYPKSPEYYKELLRGFDNIEHLTIEVNQCQDEPCC
jgi:Co/Zn/Cd efflux system component